jgi:hypothetical protein
MTHTHKLERHYISDPFDDAPYYTFESERKTENGLALDSMSVYAIRDKERANFKIEDSTDYERYSTDITKEAALVLAHYLIRWATAEEEK